MALELSPPVAIVAASPFAEENARLAALARREAPLVVEGHRTFDVGLWLSTRKDSGARFELDRREDGFRLALRGGAATSWAALGWRVPPATLAAGRRLGVLVAGTAAPALPVRLVLRHVHGTGFQDVRAEHEVLDERPGERMCHLPIRPELLAECERAEVQLFFAPCDFEARITRLETFLMT